MASYPIPPWLSTQPAQFGDAAARGAALGVQRQQLQEEARQANMNAALRGAQLQAQAKAQQDELLRQQQQQAIEQQYQQAQIGLKTREQEQAEEQWQTAFAAQREAQRRIAAGEDARKVWFEIGPRAGITGSGMGSLLRTGPGGADFKLQAQAVEGAPGWQAIETSAGHYQLVPTPAQFPNGFSLTPATDKSTGEKVPGAYWTTDEHGNPKLVHFGMSAGEAAFQYMDRRAKEMGLNPAGGEPAAAAAPITPQPRPWSPQEGMRVLQKSTGKSGVIRNGEFVPDPDQEEPELTDSEDRGKGTIYMGAKEGYWNK